MSEERKNELFYAMLDYLCTIDTEKCIDILKDIGMTKDEAIELEFFNNVFDQLPKSYE